MILHGIEYQRPTSLNMRILADHVTYSFLAFMKSIFHFCLGCYCGGYSQNGRSNLSSYVLIFWQCWCICVVTDVNVLMVMSCYTLIPILQDHFTDICWVFDRLWKWHLISRYISIHGTNRFGYDLQTMYLLTSANVKQLIADAVVLNFIHFTMLLQLPFIRIK